MFFSKLFKNSSRVLASKFKTSGVFDYKGFLKQIAEDASKEDLKRIERFAKLQFPKIFNEIGKAIDILDNEIDYADTIIPNDSSRYASHLQDDENGIYVTFFVHFKNEVARNDQRVFNDLELKLPNLNAFKAKPEGVIMEFVGFELDNYYLDQCYVEVMLAWDTNY